MHAVAEQMINAFGSSLGIEAEEPVFAPGTLVKRISENGDVRVLLVKRERDGLLEAQDVSERGRLITVTIPLGKFELEEYDESEYDCQGLDCLILYYTQQFSSRVTAELVSKVQSEKVLLDIACKAGMERAARELALERITPSDERCMIIMENLRKRHPEDKILELVCKKLTDEENLRLVTVGDKPSCRVQLTAVEQMRESESFLHAAQNSWHKNVREAALKRISDQDVLLGLFEVHVEQLHWQHAAEALECLEDSVAASNIFLAHMDTEYHKTITEDALRAAEKEGRASEHNESFVLRLLIEKLEDQEMLKRLFAYNRFMAREALYNITDLDWLLDQLENGAWPEFYYSHQWRVICERFEDLDREQNRRLLSELGRLMKCVRSISSTFSSSFGTILYAHMDKEQLVEYLLGVYRENWLWDDWGTILKIAELGEVNEKLARAPVANDSQCMQCVATRLVDDEKVLKRIARKAKSASAREVARKKLNEIEAERAPDQPDS